jgi:bacterioferritin-associated ferredoxin
MILCVCKAVSDRSIRAAIADGATSIDEVAHRTSAGTDCGVCREDVHALLEDAGIACDAGGCAHCPRRGADRPPSCASMQPP